MVSIRHVPDWQLPEVLATPERTFADRRQIVRALGLGSLGLGLSQALGCRWIDPGAPPRGLTRPAVGRRFRDLFPAPRNRAYRLLDRPVTDEATAAVFNNFYEFTTFKGDVWKLARDYPVDPWKVEVGGLVHRPRTLDLDEIMTRFPLEERLYRFRCVERWAMQVPWTGYPLRSLVEFLEPLASARYVRFVSFLDPEGLPGQELATWYSWPYYEALRLDEARSELAFVALGCYGHALPMQHGAPWRILCPWKYGYKSPKSIVRIEFTAEAPPTFWNEVQPGEYGFYSNVDPTKSHPRWSQEVEEDIGTLEKRPTELYNGYQQQVEDLYNGSEI